LRIVPYDASPSGAVGRSFPELEGVGAEISAPFSFFAGELNRSVGLSGKPFWVDAPPCCSGRFEKFLFNCESSSKEFDGLNPHFLDKNSKKWD
jgi:hypothetical protein